MAKNHVNIDSVPVEGMGSPIINNDSFEVVKGKVKTIDEQGVRETTESITKIKEERKVVLIEDAQVGNLVEIFPGSKLHILASDIESQMCPILLTLGEVVLSKDKKYTLEYEDIPIKGWQLKDRYDTKNPNAKQRCYPDEVETQKQLIECILGHESTYNCAFVNWHLEHPPEMQEKLDLEALEVREDAIAQRRLAREATYKKEMQDFEKAKKELTTKIKARKEVSIKEE